MKPALKEVPQQARSIVDRSYDATEINRIINDPSVFPCVAPHGAQGPINLTDDVANRRNILLMAEGGGFMLYADEPGIYEAHTNFLPDYRGRAVLEAVEAAKHWMFTHTDAMILQTRIPVFNKAALFAIRMTGFFVSFDRKEIWPTEKGLVDVKFYRLPYETWVEKSDQLIPIGEWFHDRLDAEYARHGKAPHSHPVDSSHDRYVGACIETIRGGQPEKAVILYNRWARFAGYGEIKLVSKDPLILDIQDAVLLLKDDDFKVIKCR